MNGNGWNEGYALSPSEKIVNRLSSIKVRRGMGAWIALVVAVLYLLTGVYTVGQGQVGVEQRLGKALPTTSEGPHWNWPWPIGHLNKLSLTKVERLEIGFVTLKDGKYKEIPEETRMMTQDENLIDGDYVVQYVISDPIRFLFNAQAPVQQLRHAAQAAMRQVIGSHTVDDVLTTGKETIQNEAKELTQQIINQYGADHQGLGLTVTAVNLQDVHAPAEVMAAFKDVATAKEEKESIINAALASQNQVIPLAKGEAAQMINEAEAYSQARVARAEGDAKQFLAMLSEYQKGKSVTRTRLYLEAMDKILPNADIVILDPKTGNVVPYLPLNNLSGGSK